MDIISDYKWEQKIKTFCNGSRTVFAIGHGIESLLNDLNINANVNELMFEVYLKTGCVSEFSFPLFVRLP